MRSWRLFSEVCFLIQANQVSTESAWGLVIWWCSRVALRGQRNEVSSTFDRAASDVPDLSSNVISAGAWQPDKMKLGLVYRELEADRYSQNHLLRNWFGIHLGWSASTRRLDSQRTSFERYLRAMATSHRMKLPKVIIFVYRSWCFVICVVRRKVIGGFGCRPSNQRTVSREDQLIHLD